ncbi:hypothetical protein [Rufibacter quisquiliarum]|uniref:Uncharacterized protein n=1 Tax=Rufibacter quisquiliarum TaxID=1549639 RepID=A0A839GS24_9BACT|nr:hypothetical protein [Rufibacter quisquiliarum]MBA9078305.1 hypothetical protein [Rufibacter quisquiliarum]
MQTAIHPETEKPRVFEALLLNAHWVPVMVVVFQFTLLGYTIGFKERRFRSPYTNRVHKLHKALRKERKAELECQQHLGIGA